MDLQVNKYTLNDTTPTLVFSGTGKVKLSASGAGGVAYGGASVTYATGSVDLQLCAPVAMDGPTDIYAIASSGASPVVTVTHWY